MLIMVFNATVNNISVVSSWSDLLVEETADLPQITDKFYHMILYCVQLTTLVGDIYWLHMEL